MAEEESKYQAFVDVFPEFLGIPEARVTFALDVSFDFFVEGLWGKHYQRACFLLTAHMLSLRYDVSEALQANGMRSPFATINIVTSKSTTTTGLSEGNATNAMQTSDNPILFDLSRTEYGLQLLALLYTVVPCSDVVFSPDASATYRGWLDR